MEVFWIDKEGRGRNSVAQGDVLLRVFRAGYIPLENVREDPNYVWKWHDNGYTYRMTTGLRAFVGEE